MPRRTKEMIEADLKIAYQANIKLVSELKLARQEIEILKKYSTSTPINTLIIATEKIADAMAHIITRRYE